MEEELWKPIRDYPDYEISNQGRVKNIKTGRLKKPTENNGYYVVHLHKDGKGNTQTIHRLVAVAFIPNPENKTCIDHKNRIRTDNRIENLRWVSKGENNLNVVSRGYTKHGDKYVAQIMKDYKMIYLGLYDTEEEANRVYIAKHIELFGEFSPYSVSVVSQSSCSGVNLQ